MDRVLNEDTDAEVAEQLNQQGFRTFEGLPFHSTHVYQLRRHHGLPDRYTRLRTQGMLCANELADAYGVTAQTIWRWYRQGRITGVRYNDRGSSLFPPKASQPLLTKKLSQNSSGRTFGNPSPCPSSMGQPRWLVRPRSEASVPLQMGTSSFAKGPVSGTKRERLSQTQSLFRLVYGS